MWYDIRFVAAKKNFKMDRDYILSLGKLLSFAIFVSIKFLPCSIFEADFNLLIVFNWKYPKFFFIIWILYYQFKESTPILN